MTTTGGRSSALVAGSACGSGVVASATAILLLAVPEVDQAYDNRHYRPADRGSPHVGRELAAWVHEQRVAHEFRIESTGIELHDHAHPLGLALREHGDGVEDPGH